MPGSRATASGSSPSPAVQRRARQPNSPRGTFLLRREERALGQTVFVQCLNEVVARCSLFTGILFVHPGLKNSHETRTSTLARQMLFEQSGSVRLDGHAAMFGCLSQAVSEFAVQVERHVHLRPLQDRTAASGPRWGYRIKTTPSTTRRVGSVSRPTATTVPRPTHAVDQMRARPDDRWSLSESAGLVRLTAGCAGPGAGGAKPGRQAPGLRPGRRPGVAWTFGRWSRSRRRCRPSDSLDVVDSRSQGSRSSTTIRASGRASGATLSPAAWWVTLW